MDSSQKHYTRLKKPGIKEHILLSRIVKDLRFYLVYKLVSFMNAGRRYETSGSETKDFMTHSNRIIQCIMPACIVGCCVTEQELGNFRNLNLS